MSWAADLIKAQDGDVIIIPLALARALGLPAAAFLRQAAYLSAVVEDQHGWFFLEQEGPANPAGKTIFERLGSWQATIGLGPDAQASIRRHLRALELLEENRKMVHGKLRYRVDSERYLNFLASCSRSPLSHCNARQTGNPDCTNRKSGLNNQEKPDCTISENRSDIYQEKIPPPLRHKRRVVVVIFSMDWTSSQSSLHSFPNFWTFWTRPTSKILGMPRIFWMNSPARSRRAIAASARRSVTHLPG